MTTEIITELNDVYKTQLVHLSIMSNNISFLESSINIGIVDRDFVKNHLISSITTIYQNRYMTEFLTYFYRSYRHELSDSERMIIMRYLIGRLMKDVVLDIDLMVWSDLTDDNKRDLCKDDAVLLRLHLEGFNEVVDTNGIDLIDLGTRMILRYDNEYKAESGEIPRDAEVFVYEEVIKHGDLSLFTTQMLLNTYRYRSMVSGFFAAKTNLYGSDLMVSCFSEVSMERLKDELIGRPDIRVVLKKHINTANICTGFYHDYASMFSQMDEADTLAFLCKVCRILIHDSDCFFGSRLHGYSSSRCHAILSSF